MEKLINDTLKYTNGKWDKQALTMFTSFVLTIIFGFTLVICSYLLNMPENSTAETVFNTFAILTGTLSGTNIANKLANIQKNKQKNLEDA